MSPDITSIKTDLGEWMRLGDKDDHGERGDDDGDARPGRRRKDSLGAGRRRTRSLEGKIGLLCHPRHQQQRAVRNERINKTNIIHKQCVQESPARFHRHQRTNLNVLENQGGKITGQNVDF